ncbi:MAG: hypothetical protein EGR16_06085 [Clostridiales bacterium]|nr:hypothetical protein [Clostridiales bacterium]
MSYYSDPFLFDNLFLLFVLILSQFCILYNIKIKINVILINKKVILRMVKRKETIYNYFKD